MRVWYFVSIWHEATSDSNLDHATLKKPTQASSSVPCFFSLFNQINIISQHQTKTFKNYLKSISVWGVLMSRPWNCSSFIIIWRPMDWGKDVNCHPRDLINLSFQCYHCLKTMEEMESLVNWSTKVHYGINLWWSLCNLWMFPTTWCRGYPEITSNNTWCMCPTVSVTV